MNTDDLIEKCECAYDERDFKKLQKLSSEILKKDSTNPIAVSYKSMSYCFSGHPQKALEILDEVAEHCPDNYYHKNIRSMAYYDLGEYEKSLKCCEEALEINGYDWLFENKMKALIMLGRIDEAIECYEYIESFYFYTGIHDLLFDVGMYDEIRDYYLRDNDFKSIDKLKLSVLEYDSNGISKLGDYYSSWISMIKYKYDVKKCPDCGGELIPILNHPPSNYDLVNSAEGQLHLADFSQSPSFNYHCKKCAHDFKLGYEGLHIECGDEKLYEYISFKIDQITDKLKIGPRVFIKSRSTVKKELPYFDEGEFEDLINHLICLEYIFEPKKDYIKLIGFDNYKTAKEYLDDGKFAAPRWFVYPQLSFKSVGWEKGYGEDYIKNHPHSSKEYDELFPMPRYWLSDGSKSKHAHHPLLTYFWREDGRPEYGEGGGKIIVNDFITLNQTGTFKVDFISFKSVEHALLLSKFMYFEKCGSEESLESLKNAFRLSDGEEKIWDAFKYSVCLNAAYFKIIENSNLKSKLLDTGDENLIYKSDDEWGGKTNLFGMVLMEIRDEIRRICENEDKIDWKYTEYVKVKSQHF